MLWKARRTLIRGEIGAKRAAWSRIGNAMGQKLRRGAVNDDSEQGQAGSP